MREMNRGDIEYLANIVATHLRQETPRLVKQSAKRTDNAPHVAALALVAIACELRLAR